MDYITHLDEVINFDIRDAAMRFKWNYQILIRHQGELQYSEKLIITHD